MLTAGQRVRVRVPALPAARGRPPIPAFDVDGHIAPRGTNAHPGPLCDGAGQYAVQYRIPGGGVCWLFARQHEIEVLAGATT